MGRLAEAGVAAIDDVLAMGGAVLVDRVDEADMRRQADGAQQGRAQRGRVVRLGERRLGQAERAVIGPEQEDRAVALDHGADHRFALGGCGNRLGEGAGLYVGAPRIAEAIAAGVAEGADAPHENCVVARVDDFVHRAVEPGSDAVEHRRAFGSG